MNKITFAFKNIMNQKTGHLEKAWHYESNALLLSSPVVSDIDGDGKKEIIFGTKNGKILSVGSNGELKWTYSVSDVHSDTELMFLDTETSNSISSTPNIEDVNMDGKKEIVFGTESGKLCVIDHDGKLLWFFETKGAIRGSPIVQKFSNNQVGILFGSLDKNLYFVTGNGKLYWKFSCDSEIESCPAFILGKQPIILFGANDGTLYALNLKGQVLWKFQTKGKIIAQPVFEKLTTTTNPMIVFGSTDGNVYCLTETGDLVWQYATQGAICSRVTIADIDNSGKKKILFGSCDNSVYALDNDGKKVWSYETDFWVVASPVISDIDGDGKLEVIVGSYDHNIYILDAEGTYVLDYVPGASGIVGQSGQYGDAVTKQPGQTRGKKIWQYQTDGIVVGCVFVDDQKNIVVNTESGKIHNIIHKND